MIARTSGLLGPLEKALESAFAGGQFPPRVVASALQYLLILLCSFGTVWLVMMSTQKIKVSWLLGGLILELLFLALVCSRFQVSFPPLPSMLAVALDLAAAHSSPAWLQAKLKTSKQEHRATRPPPSSVTLQTSTILQTNGRLRSSPRLRNNSSATRAVHS